MVDRSLLNTIKDIVLKATIYHRIYTAKVININDPRNTGLIKVSVPDLSFTAPNQSADAEFTGWAAPVTPHGLLVPKVGDFVEIYFPGGNPSQMRWFGQPTDITVNHPAAYARNTQLLWQDRTTPAFKILYDGSGNVLKICGGTEAFVKGTTFNPELAKLKTLVDQIKTSLTSFSPTGTPADTASWAAAVTVPLSPLQNGDFSQILSQKIKGE